MKNLIPKGLISISCICLLIAFAGCGGKKSDLVYSNDMDNYVNWTSSCVPKNIVRLGKAHSGKYACQIDSGNVFSATYKMNLYDVSQNPVTKVTVTGWFTSKDGGSEPFLAIDVHD